ncbi:hypothetical protein AVW25_12580 [Salmonella enterica]|nr:hypothetical protein [Salmonella enterica subsp. enterica serovar Singapore]EAA4014730.1 hypothetical protein [Salmonella enterica subsp. enterica serovar Newport]EAA9297031.1 hypothetical protein [Salmonella enterica subsp. enterica serovar Enteritidis]EAQ6832107.1 hypothetical protein [Salmonella enterica]EBV5763688.1 hypothetical protein [Salmonella enterica subsp. enterica serovar Hvittingfoss]EBX8422402.1 hypothetical protein [Salmonella enterica subsp. enterica serovar Urbana]ECI6209
MPVRTYSYSQFCYRYQQHFAGEKCFTGSPFTESLVSVKGDPVQFIFIEFLNPFFLAILIFCHLKIRDRKRNYVIQWQKRC